MPVMEHSRESKAILRLAFVDSLPVLMGCSTMGFVAGTAVYMLSLDFCPL